MIRLADAWLHAPSSQKVCNALTSQGFAAYFVGGCVRNALLSRPVSDIDIATDARPEQTLKCADQAGLRSIPTGAAHGTITVIADGVSHEITSFRDDVETDGRHAKVRFSTDLATDAARRDFTMNALYATPDGVLVDPLGGLPDLRARHVRFIGDPTARITEDYLRILRFFRFTAQYGNPELGIDAEGLAACTANMDGLSKVSNERIGAELYKLFSAEDPAPAVAAMRSSGLLNTLLPGATDTHLAVLVHLEQLWKQPPDAIRRFAVIGDTEGADRLRLSKADIRRWALLRDCVGATTPVAHLAYLHGGDIARDTLLLRAALLESDIHTRDFQAIKAGAAAIFPVKAADLQPALSGPALGAALRDLKARWMASDFQLSRDALLK